MVEGGFGRRELRIARAVPGPIEAAAIDGASEMQLFLRIAVPLAGPALAAVAVFQFMFVWNDLLVSLIYLGGSPDVAPLTVAVSNLVNSRGEGWEVLTAARSSSSSRCNASSCAVCWPARSRAVEEHTE